MRLRRSTSAQRRRRLGLLLALFTIACEGNPADVLSPDVEPPPGFTDTGVLADGTVVRHDQGIINLRDAAVFTEAGVCRTGRTSGVACLPGGAPLIEAQIEAATTGCDGQPLIVSTVADQAGRFRLNGLAPGPTQITISSGNFVTRLTVNIIADVDVPASGGISNKVCLESDSAHLAVLTGDYDTIQSVLDELGFEYDLYCGDSSNHRPARQMLSDWAALSAYNIVFINCSTGINLRATNPETQIIIDNLRRFVREGGSIYVSDLSADFVSAIWPDTVRFAFQPPAAVELDPCCVCTACAPDCETPPAQPNRTCSDPSRSPVSCQRRTGVIGRGVPDQIDAQIESPFLRNFLDQAEMTVVFNLGGWIEIEAVDLDTVEILVRADGQLNNAPLMVLAQPDEAGGRVAYTSFHNHVQATDAMRLILSALILRL